MDQQYFGVSLEKLLTSGGQTLYMVAWSLIIGTIIGIILAVILVLCRKGGLAENRILYNIVSIYIKHCKKHSICNPSCSNHATDKEQLLELDWKYGIVGTTCYLHQSISGTIDGEQFVGN